VTEIQTASHWGVYSVREGDDGQLETVGGFAGDREPPPLIESLPKIARDKLRIDQPYVREGFLKGDAAPHNRGGDRFVPMGWDAALDLVQRELVRVKQTYGNEAIYGGSYGWASAGRLHHSPSVLKRFLGLFGGYVDKLGNHSFGAAMHIMPYVIGRGDISHQTMAWPLIVEHTDLVVMFGGAHIKNSQLEAGGVASHDGPYWYRQAAAAGVKFVNISPSRDDLPPEVAPEWLPIRPNTDVAMMLALAHTIVTAGRHDRGFLSTHCVGFDEFELYLLGLSDGQPKDADWAATITGIAAETTRALALRMVAGRTLVNTSWSVQRAEHGEQPVWMTAVLGAIIGQVGLPGGGFSLGLGASAGIAMPRAKRIPRPKLELGPNAVTNHIPVGRVTEMLLNPGKVIDYDGRKVTLPHARLIYSVGGNPFHHNTNINRFLAGWQQPDTIIVHEPWWSPAARFADIVLPATTTLERNDIQAAELSHSWIAMHQAMAPHGLARNDFDIFAELAGRLGFGEAYAEGRDEMGWLAHMYETARAEALALGHEPPPFAEFWREGSYEFAMKDEAPEVFLGAFRDDPEARRLRTPSGRIEINSATLARFGYADCASHPRWFQPREWAAAGGRFRLHLLSNQPLTRLHSQLDPAPISRDSKIAGREPLSVGRVDAAARGLADGDVVRVFNDRGQFLAGVRVVDSLVPGTIQMATGAWYDPAEPGRPGSLEKHGNPNVVTNDEGTSRLAQSSTAQSVLVEIEKVSAPPAVTAFEVPVAAGFP
jgi:biotin/methionine sulfoxide reductase